MLEYDRKKNLMDGVNMDDLCDRKIEEDKTNSMLRLDLNKILKLFIGDENMLTFMNALSKVRIFL